MRETQLVRLLACYCDGQFQSNHPTTFRPRQPQRDARDADNANSLTTTCGSNNPVFTASDDAAFSLEKTTVHENGPSQRIGRPKCQPAGVWPEMRAGNGLHTNSQADDDDGGDGERTSRPENTPWHSADAAGLDAVSADTADSPATGGSRHLGSPRGAGNRLPPVSWGDRPGHSRLQERETKSCAGIPVRRRGDGSAGNL